MIYTASPLPRPELCCKNPLGNNDHYRASASEKKNPLETKGKEKKGIQPALLDPKSPGDSTSDINKNGDKKKTK